MKYLLLALYICSFSLCCASASDLIATNSSSAKLSASTDGLLSKKDFARLHAQAYKAMNEGDYSGAAEMFEKLLLHSKPKSIFVWKTHELLGGIYFNTKSYEQSEKHLITFTRLCLEHPESLFKICERVATAFIHLGHAQKEQCKYKEAITSYESAGRYKPALKTDMYVRGGLAFCYLATGQEEKGRKLLRDGIA